MRPFNGPEYHRFITQCTVARRLPPPSTLPCSRMELWLVLSHSCLMDSIKYFIFNKTCFYASIRIKFITAPRLFSLVLVFLGYASCKTTRYVRARPTTRSWENPLFYNEIGIYMKVSIHCTHTHTHTHVHIPAEYSTICNTRRSNQKKK